MADFFAKHWGTPEMVISSGIFRCNELDGYAAVDESGEIIGCITYVIDGKDCEIISLDSIIEEGLALLYCSRLKRQLMHIVIESSLSQRMIMYMQWRFIKKEVINSPHCFRTQLKKRDKSSQRSL